VLSAAPRDRKPGLTRASTHRSGCAHAMTPPVQRRRHRSARLAHYGDHAGASTSSTQEKGAADAQGRQRNGLGRPEDRAGIAEPVRLYRVPEAMALLSLSRSVLYEQIRAGRLKSVTQGRTRLIPATALADYVTLLLQEADGQPRS